MKSCYFEDYFWDPKCSLTGQHDCYSFELTFLLRSLHVSHFLWFFCWHKIGKRLLFFFLCVHVKGHDKGSMVGKIAKGTDLLLGILRTYRRIAWCQECRFWYQRENLGPKSSNYLPVAWVFIFFSKRCLCLLYDSWRPFSPFGDVTRIRVFSHCRRDSLCKMDFVCQVCQGPTYWRWSPCSTWCFVESIGSWQGLDSLGKYETWGSSKSDLWSIRLWLRKHTSFWRASILAMIFQST